MNTDRLHELLETYLDERSTPEEQSELEALLREHPEAREQYWQEVWFHMEMRSAIAVAAGATEKQPTWDATAPDPGESERMGASPRSHTSPRVGVAGVDRGPLTSFLHNSWQFVHRKPVTSALAATVVLGIVFGALALTQAPSGLRPDPNSLLTERPFGARLARTHEAVWGRVSPGAPGLAAGDRDPQTLHTNADLFIGDRLYLKSGMAEIYFAKGTIAVLEGPAVLSIEGNNHCALSLGKLGARIEHAGAKGFSVWTPSATVTDLGTEFQCIVDKQGVGEVQVTQGEVEVQIAADTGEGEPGRVRTGPKISLTAGEKVTIGPDGSLGKPTAGEVTTIELPASAESTGPLPSLTITPEYLDLVKAARPAAWWRFEEILGGQIQNEVAGGPALKIQGKVALDEAGRGNRAVLLEPRNGYLTCADSIDELIRGDYTIEAWFKPQRDVNQGVIAAVLVAHTGRTPMHGLMIATCADARRHDIPFRCVRYLHRWPAGALGGADAYSRNPYSVGLWNHVAAVRRADRTEVYLNGTPTAVRESAPAFAADSAQLVLGQLMPGGTDRAFHGLLDELVIYAHALEAREIEKHLRAARPK